MIRQKTIIVLILGLFISCEKQDKVPEENQVEPVTIEVISGNNQTGTVGEQLTKPIEIIVKDRNGIPYEGAIVNYIVSEGTISSRSLTTTPEGKASVKWELPTTIGNKSLTIISYSLDGKTHLSGSPITVFSISTEKTELYVLDIEDNKYKTIKIGDQIWMAENLRTTKYNDGTDIPNITDNLTWATLTTPAYCWYNNNEDEYKQFSGALYNGFVVRTKKVCPVGWHVPNSEEYEKLLNYIKKDGFQDIEGHALKAKAGWNVNGLDTYGFNAKPSGYRNGYWGSDGTFSETNLHAGWWSSTPYWREGNDYFSVSSDSKYASVHSKRAEKGSSIRCVKN